MKKALGILPCLLTALLLLSGCKGESIEQYFSLPKVADEYLQLQELIDSEIAGGCEYAAPTAGSRRQPIELLDIDADGTDEAVVFLRDSNGGGKINFYKPYRDSYELTLTIRQDGCSAGHVDFADLTGDGICDLTVSWRMGRNMRMLSVYDLSGWGGDVLLECACTEFITGDLADSRGSELAVITQEEDGGTVTLYSFPENSEVQSCSAPLSAGIADLERIRLCTLEGHVPALLVESFCEDGALVSDLFTSMEQGLYNILLDPESGVSRTRRSYAVFSTDIDSDGCIEFPFPSSLFSQEAELNFWSIAWHGVNRYGQSTEEMESYHCYSDGWYFILPDSWQDTLTVRREDDIAGERSVILSEVNRSNGEVTDKLIIYTLTGSNRVERSHLDGRFVLQEESDTIYVAKILGGISEEDVKTRFQLIYTEWNTGTV